MTNDEITAQADEAYGRATNGPGEKLPFRAVGWRIIVEPFKAAETEGVIALPKETVAVQKVNEYRGTVVSVGPLAYQDPVKFQPTGHANPGWCNVGDVVAYDSRGGKRMFAADGREYRVMNDEDIIARITDPAAMKNPY